MCSRWCFKLDSEKAKSLLIDSNFILVFNWSHEYNPKPRALKIDLQPFLWIFRRRIKRNFIVKSWIKGNSWFKLKSWMKNLKGNWSLWEETKSWSMWLEALLDWNSKGETNHSQKS